MAFKKKQGAAARKRDGIHFVNARPSSETERLKAQRLVRAHVGRWISDQTKDRTSTIEPSSSISSATGPGPGPGSMAPANVSSDHACPSSYGFVSHSLPSASHCANHVGRRLPVSADIVSRREWQRPFFPPSHASDSSDSSDDASSIATPPNNPAAITPRHEVSRIEPQISGAFDPFCTHPSRFSPDVVDACKKYCYSILWPGLIPTRRKQAGELWFPLSLSDPALFTAFMFGSLCHQRVQWLNNWVPGSTFGPKQERALQLCEMEAIKLINEAVRDPSRAVSDAVLLSVICMAHHQAPAETNLSKHRKTAFNPPFQRMQWLDVYGCLPPNMIHIQGLLQLVQLRGGLDNIKLRGLRPTISFSDILTASVLCIRPAFVYWPVDDIRNGMTLQALLGFSPSDVERGFGQLYNVGVTPQLAEALQGTYAYINIVKANRAVTYDVSLLADQRNLTQHNLLSVPPAAELEPHFSHATHFATYEACRLAAQIFGVGVVFPIPAQNTPLRRLASQLHSVLRHPNSSSLWCSSNTRVPLIWILTLGGIAAHGTPERSFYASALGAVARQSNINSWSEVKRTLEIMLWYDEACDEAGEELWYEYDACTVE